MTFFVHVMPLVKVSLDANGITNGTIAFLSQNEVQQDLLYHVMQLALALASSDADGVTNGIIAFLWSGLVK